MDNRKVAAAAQPSWQMQLDGLLPLMGHRNWIIIADEAFPLQSSPGMVYISTGAALPEVAGYTMHLLSSSAHVQPVLKTNTTPAYSSAFINLDCKYRSEGKEQQLREAMSKN